MRNIKSFIGIVLLIILAFFIGTYFGFLQGTKSSYLVSIETKSTEDKKSIEKVDFNLFYQVLKTINDDFALKEKIDPQQMVYGATRGLVQALNDPFSVFMLPQEAKDFNAEIEGELSGIGAELEVVNGKLTIVAPLKDSPAEKAGLLAGDVVSKIDGQPTGEMTVDGAISKIRGLSGTKVILTIKRVGKGEEQDIEITRQTIELSSVDSKQLANGLVYIDIKKFDNDTEVEFYNLITDLLPKEPKGIILDVRNNPGGYMSSPLEIASEFIKGEQVVLKRTKENGDEEVLKSTGSGRLVGMPTVLLVNKGSASGAEILAGILQDYKLAKLVGETTFGKGTVQEVTEFPDGSSLKLTVSKWFTPLGRNINEQGIKPDVEVKDNPDTEADEQLEEAIKQL